MIDELHVYVIIVGLKDGQESYKPKANAKKIAPTSTKLIALQHYTLKYERMSQPRLLRCVWLAALKMIHVLVRLLQPL